VLADNFWPNFDAKAFGVGVCVGHATQPESVQHSASRLSLSLCALTLAVHVPHTALTIGKSLGLQQCMGESVRRWFLWKFLSG